MLSLRLGPRQTRVSSLPFNVLVKPLASATRQEKGKENLTVLQMYEITSLKGLGRKGANPSNCGNEWNLYD